MEDNNKIKKPRAKTYRYKSGDIFRVSFNDGICGNIKNCKIDAKQV